MVLRNFFNMLCYFLAIEKLIRYSLLFPCNWPTTCSRFYLLFSGPLYISRILAPQFDQDSICYSLARYKFIQFATTICWSFPVIFWPSINFKSLLPQQGQECPQLAFDGWSQRTSTTNRSQIIAKWKVTVITICKHVQCRM